MTDLSRVMSPKNNLLSRFDDCPRRPGGSRGNSISSEIWKPWNCIIDANQQPWTSMRSTYVDNSRLCSPLLFSVRWSSMSQPTSQQLREEEVLSQASCGRGQKEREKRKKRSGCVSSLCPLCSSVWDLGSSELLLSGEDQGKPFPNGAWSRWGR